MIIESKSEAKTSPPVEGVGKKEKRTPPPPPGTEEIEIDSSEVEKLYDIEELEQLVENIDWSDMGNISSESFNFNDVKFKRAFKSAEQSEKNDIETVSKILLKALDRKKTKGKKRIRPSELVKKIREAVAKQESKSANVESEDHKEYDFGEVVDDLLQDALNSAGSVEEVADRALESADSVDNLNHENEGLERVDIKRAKNQIDSDNDKADKELKEEGFLKKTWSAAKRKWKKITTYATTAAAAAVAVFGFASMNQEKPSTSNVEVDSVKTAGISPENVSTDSEKQNKTSKNERQQSVMESSPSASFESAGETSSEEESEILGSYTTSSGDSPIKIYKELEKMVSGDQELESRTEFFESIDVVKLSDSQKEEVKNILVNEKDFDESDLRSIKIGDYLHGSIIHENQNFDLKVDKNGKIKIENPEDIDKKESYNILVNGKTVDLGIENINELDSVSNKVASSNSETEKDPNIGGAEKEAKAETGPKKQESSPEVDDFSEREGLNNVASIDGNIFKASPENTENKVDGGREAYQVEALVDSLEENDRMIDRKDFNKKLDQLKKVNDSEKRKKKASELIKWLRNDQLSDQDLSAQEVKIMNDLQNNYRKDLSEQVDSVAEEVSNQVEEKQKATAEESEEIEKENEVLSPDVVDSVRSELKNKAEKMGNSGSLAESPKLLESYAKFMLSHKNVGGELATVEHIAKHYDSDKIEKLSDYLVNLENDSVKEDIEKKAKEIMVDIVIDHLKDNMELDRFAFQWLQQQQEVSQEEVVEDLENIDSMIRGKLISMKTEQIKDLLDTSNNASDFMSKLSLTN